MLLVFLEAIEVNRFREIREPVSNTGFWATMAGTPFTPAKAAPFLEQLEAIGLANSRTKVRWAAREVVFFQHGKSLPMKTGGTTKARGPPWCILQPKPRFHVAVLRNGRETIR